MTLPSIRRTALHSTRSMTPSVLLRLPMSHTPAKGSEPSQLGRTLLPLCGGHLGYPTSGHSNRVVTFTTNTDTASRQPILVGYAASDMHWPGYLSFAHSPASRGSAQHGVEVRYNRDQGTITIVLGNSGCRATDSGIFFDVFGIDPTGMVGLWEDGGLGDLIDSAGKNLGHPRGSFCLRRTQG